MKILIVEDQLIQASKLKLDIEELGEYQVAIAATAEASLALCQRNKYGVIFLDIELSGSDGVEFLQMLSQLPRRPKIVISSKQDSKLIALITHIAKQLGFHSITRLDKPYSSQVLSLCLKPEIRDEPSQLGERHDASPKGQKLLFQPVIQVTKNQVLYFEASFQQYDVKDTPKAQFLAHLKLCSML